MYHLKLDYHFDSAHQLKLNYKSACERLHGHRWRVIIDIWSVKLDENGILIDFKKLKQIIDELDHRFLNDIVDFNPTAENISKYLYNKITEKLEQYKKVKITLFESPEASITYED